MYDTVNCVVDTSEMAASVDSVSGHINGTTAAVVAMQAAVIKTERDAAAVICDNVDRGFLALMQSQISTKKAQHLSDLNARMVKLMELTKALKNKEQRMETDVDRLHRQYYKTFHSMDNALENRVRQLDKPSMLLAEERKNLITAHQLRDITTVTCGDQEAHNTAQMALTARIRSKTSRALSSIGTNVMENEQYRDEVAGVLENQSVAKNELECVPFLYVTEASMVMRGSSVSQVFLPEDMPTAARDVIENRAMQAIDLLGNVSKSQEERNEVAREFRNMTAQANLNPKIAGLMMQMFEKGGC